ncbi:hypothetical protein CYLTODRAFT_457303 [Cylindrobasidium torrendii FP15055 ss-10]|uniref:Uncharacterized protein n=1 Tax=Cylindrobasidium torrendii FP15055 ss-10 TaxID=1314674 RepID=A0A0D7B1K0_9AGAR|nr:hypothetical protein CYLTODRAFT_457303 [Cylindrobasidium torrendii FP15055 ss-10]
MRNYPLGHYPKMLSPGEAPDSINEGRGAMYSYGWIVPCELLVRAMSASCSIAAFVEKTWKERYPEQNEKYLQKYEDIVAGSRIGPCVDSLDWNAVIVRIMTNRTDEAVRQVMDDKEYLQDIRKLFAGVEAIEKDEPVWIRAGIRQIPQNHPLYVPDSE